MRGCVPDNRVNTWRVQRGVACEHDHGARSSSGTAGRGAGGSTSGGPQLIGAVRTQER